LSASSRFALTLPVAEFKSSVAVSGVRVAQRKYLSFYDKLMLFHLLIDPKIFTNFAFMAPDKVHQNGGILILTNTHRSIKEINYFVKADVYFPKLKSQSNLGFKVSFQKCP
jgi:hypothetical protein